MDRMDFFSKNSFIIIKTLAVNKYIIVEMQLKLCLGDLVHLQNTNLLRLKGVVSATKTGHRPHEMWHRYGYVYRYWKDMHTAISQNKKKTIRGYILVLFNTNKQ